MSLINTLKAILVISSVLCVSVVGQFSELGCNVFDASPGLGHSQVSASACSVEVQDNFEPCGPTICEPIGGSCSHCLGARNHRTNPPSTRDEPLPDDLYCLYTDTEYTIDSFTYAANSIDCQPMIVETADLAEAFTSISFLDNTITPTDFSNATALDVFPGQLICGVRDPSIQVLTEAFITAPFPSGLSGTVAPGPGPFVMETVPAKDNTGASYDFSFWQIRACVSDTRSPTLMPSSSPTVPSPTTDSPTGSPTPPTIPLPTIEPTVLPTGSAEDGSIILIAVGGAVGGIAAIAAIAGVVALVRRRGRS